MSEKLSVLFPLKTPSSRFEPSSLEKNPLLWHATTEKKENF
jgi:hypothetical protein